MKTVLLTCSTGQGHNSAAQAVRLALEARGALCETLDALTFLGDNVSEAITNAFVDIAVKTPRAFGFMYAAGEFIRSDKRKSPVYFANALYAENLHRYLEEEEIDAAVCPHLFPAEALTYLRRKHSLSTRCYYVSTDYTCIPFLEETDLDVVFTPHADLSSQFIRRGIRADRLCPVGIPVRDDYRTGQERSDARALLNLPANLPCFLVMTGGEGCGDAVTLTRKLLERLKNRDARIVVLTGRNAGLQNALASRFNEDLRVLAIPFTEQVPLYMDACDVLLTKPGGISSTEAAVKGIPIVHTPPIPGVETRNAQFFAERGMSIVAPNEDSAADNALRLAADAPQRARMLEAQRQYLSRDAAEHIAARILEGRPPLADATV
ncbi:MAG: glycosyl transferase [Eubacteriales bacterium]|nr:glycosyl transferase [Eubacteriales bacterium]